MAWVLVDDLTGDRIDLDDAHSVTILVDSRIVEKLEHLTDTNAEIAARQLQREVGRMRANAVLDDRRSNGYQLPAEPDPEPHPPGPTSKDPITWTDRGDDDEPMQVGEAVSGRASDATVRAWCAENGVQHSTHGRLNVAAREAYEQAHQLAPDAGDPEPAAALGSVTADEDPPAPDPARKATSKPAAKAPPPRTKTLPPSERSIPSVSPRHATDSVIRVWCYRNGLPVPDSGDVGDDTCAAYTAAYERGADAPEPAVEPAGDGNRPRPEQLDEAVRRIENGEALNDVSAHTAIPVRQVREIKRQIDAGEVVTG